MVNLYRFTDIDKDPLMDKGLLTFINGISIENKIEGFKTLTVKGREMISNVLSQIEDIEGRDGSIVTSSKLPPRIIEVKYLLEAKNSRRFQDSFRRLNLLLRDKIGEDSVFTFSDEWGTFYYGQLEEVGEVPEHSNKVVSTFTIYCQDPYKYGRVVELKGNPIQVGFHSSYPTIPEEISFYPGSDSKLIKISNLTTGRRIIMNGSYTSRNKVVIKISGEQNQIMVGGRNAMKDLSLDSDFGSFKVSPLDKIRVTPSSDMTIKIRGKWL